MLCKYYVDIFKNSKSDIIISNLAWGFEMHAFNAYFINLNPATDNIQTYDTVLEVYILLWVILFLLRIPLKLLMR